MNRRSFLLLASGAGLLAPRIENLPRQSRNTGRIASALCRGPIPSASAAALPASRTALPASNIPKFVEPLPTFEGARVSATEITVSIEEFQQYVLPASLYAESPAPYDHGTFVWGYKVGNAPPHYPGFTVEARRGTPTTVSYLNNLPLQPRLQQYLKVDQTLHWADPFGQMGSLSPYAGPPPVVTHLHGGEVPSVFDGHPEAWFTPGRGRTGPDFATSTYTYPNAQETGTLWFHDHALGITRLNVYAGLTGIYLLRDAYDTGVAGTGLDLPSGKYEVELTIQDRQFDINGQWFFPAGEAGGLNGTPPNPEAHPFWLPEFFGDAIVVNGKTWPYLMVEPRRYRFRILNACNARFLELALTRGSWQRPGPTIWQIGTDGGLLDQPVPIGGRGRKRQGLLLAPAERADIVVDFAAFAHESLVFLNGAKAPYPAGDAPDPATNGQVMQFRVELPRRDRDASFDPAAPRAALRGGKHRAPAIVRLTSPERGTVAPGVTISKRRQLTLVEAEGAGGPLQALVNNSRWEAATSELPQIGSTELWEIINLTEDAHPMHLHLVQFQLLNRQGIRAERYLDAYSVAFPGEAFIPGYGPPRDYNIPNADFAVGGNPELSPFLRGAWRPPEPGENGWKDTIRALPGEVTRLVVRWAPLDAPLSEAVAGTNLFPFDPTDGPGYVWHCHVLDHEDNDMMRRCLPSR